MEEDGSIPLRGGSSIADGHPWFESTSSAGESRIWEGKARGSGKRSVKPFRIFRERLDSSPSHQNYDLNGCFKYSITVHN